MFEPEKLRIRRQQNSPETTEMAQHPLVDYIVSKKGANLHPWILGPSNKPQKK